LVLLRPKAAVPGLGGKLSYRSGDKRVIFEYEVIRLWKEPVDQFLHAGLNLLPLAPLCKLPQDLAVEDAMRRVVGEIDRRLAALDDQARAVRLMTAAFILSGMRIPKERLSGVYEGVRIMHKTTAWDSAVDEGIIKGELRILLMQGRDRFGDPDAKIESVLRAINDLERLERMAIAIHRVRSWKGLLAIK
jgi:hypothetical protein